MIKITDLSFGYRDKVLYENVSFSIGNGQKVGLVGPNGSGKSTLFKMLTGQEDGYRGKIEIHGSVGVVPQEVKRDPEMEKASSVRKYVDTLGAYPDHEILKLFKGLELSVGLAAVPKSLSGGQKTKLALAKVLFSNADTLLLDEPTNFMDTAGTKWVMNFLSNYQGTVIVVSHDLRLMDNSIDKILSVEPNKRQIVEYKGNYTAYLRLKKEKEELEGRQLLVKQKHIMQMEKGLSKMKRLTSVKGVRARVRQQKRIEREKALLPEAPPELKTFKISLPVPAKIGEIPIMASGISKKFGNIGVLDNMEFVIERGQRLCLIGPNGVGKSTFIKILMGILQPDSGQVKIHDLAKIGYYSQEFETFDLKRSVIDIFTDSTNTDERFARAFLGRYMFSGEKVFQRTETLSGGEKTRLSIAILTAGDNNVLILDEPTTYLDVVSQRIILESLKEYQGTMIVVSHTPEFISELRPDKAVLFPEQKTVFWDEKYLDRVDTI